MNDTVVAYTIQENRDSQIYLCVIDDANGKFHRFPLNQLGCSRLAYECSGYVNRALGGYSRPEPK